MVKLRQTRRLEGAIPERECGFESHRDHQMQFKVGDRVSWSRDDHYYGSAYVPPNIRGTVLGIKVHSDWTEIDYLYWEDTEENSAPEVFPIVSNKVEVQWDNGLTLLHHPGDLTLGDVLERLSDIE